MKNTINTATNTSTTILPLCCRAKNLEYRVTRLAFYGYDIRPILNSCLKTKTIRTPKQIWRMIRSNEEYYHHAKNHIEEFEIIHHLYFNNKNFMTYKNNSSNRLDKVIDLSLTDLKTWAKNKINEIIKICDNNQNKALHYITNALINDCKSRSIKTNIYSISNIKNILESEYKTPLIRTLINLTIGQQFHY